MVDLAHYFLDDALNSWSAGTNYHQPMSQESRGIDRRKFLKVAGVSSALSLFGTPFGESAARAASAADIAHGSRAVPNVALTFHGASTHAMGQELLDIFTSTKTPVTVFAVGTWLAQNPTFAREILDAGHDLGNHTMNHLQMKTLNAAKAHSEIAQCAAELVKVSGSHGKWFRPSGTQHSNAIIRKAAVSLGYKQCISYDVDSHDYQDVSKNVLISNVMKSVKNGSIVSLHFGHRNTIQALPTLLSELQSQGLTPVTLTTLLGK